jgi:hypothetical protein
MRGVLPTALLGLLASTTLACAGGGRSAAGASTLTAPDNLRSSEYADAATHYQRACDDGS